MVGSVSEQSGILGVVKEIVRQLCDGELTKEQGQLIIEHHNPFAKVIGMVSSVVERAREIMGRNFLGVDAVVRRFRVSVTDEIAKAFSVIPFAEEVLKAAKNDHILVADFGNSFLDIRDKVGRGLFYDQNWYDSYRWAREGEAPQWRLIRKDAVPDSFNKNWGEQQSLLQANEVVPRVRQMAYVIMLNYLENNERLFEHTWVRTLAVDSSGDHVLLGSIAKDGLDVSTGLTTAAAALSVSLPPGNPEPLIFERLNPCSS